MKYSLPSIFLNTLVKVLGKVWPGFKNKYDLDIYDLRFFQIFCFFKEYFHRCISYKSMNTKSKAE